MALSNSILRELRKNSIMLTSLHGVRTVLERELELKNLMIAYDETIKQQLQRKGNVEYPYSYLSLSELVGIKDRTNTHAIKHHGFRLGTFGATRATSRKAYLFPVTLGVTLRYLDNDPYRVMLLAEAIAILSQIHGISFEMKFTEDFSIMVKIEIPDTTPIPIADTGNTQEPAGMDVSVSLVIHTYAGFFKDVSAVNSDSPIANFEIIMKDEL
jgi:hypothetical protein